MPHVLEVAVLVATAELAVTLLDNTATNVFKLAILVVIVATLVVKVPSASVAREISLARLVPRVVRVAISLLRLAVTVATLVVKVATLVVKEATLAVIVATLVVKTAMLVVKVPSASVAREISLARLVPRFVRVAISLLRLAAMVVIFAARAASAAKARAASVAIARPLFVTSLAKFAARLFTAATVENWVVTSARVMKEEVMLSIVA